MDAAHYTKALRLTGKQLRADHPDTADVTLYVIGGVAGLLRGWLADDRTTIDCDVMHLEPETAWEKVKSAANTIRPQLGLEDNWLNRESSIFAWQMALGWRLRCEYFDDFGPLRVMTLSRKDLIAAKVMAASKRPQDRQDLQSLAPSPNELDFVKEHLNRIEAETEPGHCAAQERILTWLRKQKEG